MRYLNKIIFLNSAHIPYAEVKLDGIRVGQSLLLRGADDHASLFKVNLMHPMSEIFA